MRREWKEVWDKELCPPGQAPERAQTDNTRNGSQEAHPATGL